MQQHPQRPPSAAELIRAAIAAAPGRTRGVAKALSRTTAAVTHWQRTGSMPASLILPLVRLQSVVTAEQILEALARESSQKAETAEAQS